MTTGPTTSAQTFDLASVKIGASNYQPSASVTELMRSDDRQRAGLTDLAGIEGSGTIIDNGWDRWHYIVTPGKPNILTLQLQAADVITWWKAIEVYASLFGHWFSINRHLGTVNDQRMASVDLTSTDAQSSTLKLDFWKAGFLNSGSYVFTQILDVPSSLGKTVTYLCSRDNPGQP